MRYGKWDIGEELGKGGQGQVFRAINTKLVDVENKIVPAVQRSLDEARAMGFTEKDRRDSTLRLLQAIETYIRRMDDPRACGALKVLLPEIRDDPKARARLEREVAVLSTQHHAHIVTMLEASVTEGWYVTEYFPQGSLEKHLARFRRQPVDALVAFRSLVEAVASLHSQNITHRDIAPKNVFLAGHGLVLGDFGLVYQPASSGGRVPSTYENVGSRDWMPPWAMGTLQEEPRSAFDVFSLGKILWAMVSGRHILPLWYFRNPKYDLEVQFPGDESMGIVNALLDQCVVENEENCLNSAQEFLEAIDDTLDHLPPKVGTSPAPRKYERRPLPENERERFADALRESEALKGPATMRTREALKDMASTWTPARAIEKDQFVMSRLVRYIGHDDVEASKIALEILHTVGSIAPESMNEPWAEKARTVCLELSLQPQKPGRIFWPVVRFLALAPEERDVRYLAFALGKWPDSVYAEAPPMEWLKATYRRFPAGVRAVVDVFLTEGTPPGLLARATSAQEVMRVVDQSRAMET